MAGDTSKRLALDTNLLLDLAAGQDFAHSFRELAGENGYTLVVPPTVVRELAYLHDHGTSGERELARNALESMLDWKIQPFNLLPVGNGIAHEFSDMIRRRGFLDEDKVNDGIILAEAALFDVKVLVTSDHHLLDLEGANLGLAFADSDLPPVAPIHPKNFSRVFRARRR
jgi:predicted nucleic acid-binding protein